MIKARTRRIIQGADYSAQEPRCLSALCKDEGMLRAYKEGKDLYVEIAAISFHLPYKKCLEHFPKGTPIKENDGHWFYAKLKSGEEDDINNFEDLTKYLDSDFDPELYDYDKLADGETDTYDDGKEYRSQAKKILLGIMYGRGEKSIAEQLGCEKDEARAIKDNVYTAFPGIKEFEDASNKLAKEHGYITTLWGRKRRLSDYKLPPYEFYYLENKDTDKVRTDINVSPILVESYTEKLLSYEKFRDRMDFIKKLREKENILVVDNGNKIARAQRQIINSRVQGSSADMSKLACIKIYNDEELRKRNVKIIIPVHDEILIETPLRYAKTVKKQFAYDMCEAPQPTLGIPMSVDVVSSDRWYGEELDLNSELQDLPDV